MPQVFGFFNKVRQPAVTKRPTVVPEPSFNLPIALGALAGFAAYEHTYVPAALFGLLGAFLALQATRVRCAAGFFHIICAWIACP